MTTDKAPTLDEQIADIADDVVFWQARKDTNLGELAVAEAILASLQALKAINAVQVPEEPKHVGFIRSSLQYAPPPTTAAVKSYRQDKELISYIDTLRDLLRRESAEKWDAAMVANIADEKRLDAEHQLAAIMKLGENPSEEMVLSALQLEPRFKDRHWDKNHLTHREIFTAMFAKLVEQSKEQWK